MTIEDTKIEIEYAAKSRTVRLGDVAYVGMFFQVDGVPFQVIQMEYSKHKYIRCIQYDPDKPGPYNFSLNELVEPAIAAKITLTFER